MRYSARVRARGAAIFAATCVAGCLFPSLDELGGDGGGIDASVDAAGPDVIATDSNSEAMSDVIVPPGDGGAGCPVSEANLIGYWKLDEGSGLIAHDCSGNGRDGTFVYGTQSSWVTGHKDAGAAISSSIRWRRRGA